MSELAQRIKAWRHALGLTQDEFARRAGIPKRTLVGYENAEREPGSSALAAIARTGVDMRWLLTGEGEMLPKPAPDQEESETVPGPRGRRWHHLIELVETSDDPDGMLADLFARAQDEARRRELERALIELRAELDRLKKRA
ncbi:helix-turn-helix domain-containing protein [Pseudothauera hydrothermalis]|uniref:helix-turn-helix domain-containing protein n=1 Tax=Pseudothauera hydrothermalis TaxID=2184083 RepID=UPI000E090AF4|nr:helix-turn-helix domain-containing protein [Pseudothauera hydrothermalis]